MVYILAGPNADTGPLSTRAIAAVARQKQVPVLVDAAAEILTVPNVHLENGATLVGYSGGKCLRGPQSAGLLLGRKDLVQAAWVHSAPHHGFSRSMKVGKEEAIGMLDGGRDVDQAGPQGRMEPVALLARRHREAGHEDRRRHDVGDGNEELSNRTPSLVIRWDPKRLGITGAAVARHLMDTEPRITTPGGADRDGESSISITPYQMAAGDEKIVAERLHATLSNPPAPTRLAAAPPAAAPVADLSGQWDVRIEYLASTSTHTLHLRQTGSRIEGTHQGDFVSRDLSGTIDGNRVQLSSPTPSATEIH